MVTSKPGLCLAGKSKKKQSSLSKPPSAGSWRPLANLRLIGMGEITTLSAGKRKKSETKTYFYKITYFYKKVKLLLHWQPEFIFSICKASRVKSFSSQMQGKTYRHFSFPW